MTYDSRLTTLPLIISNMRQQSIYADLCIWSNCTKNLHLDNDILLFKGNNQCGLMQRFLPALVSNHEYVMYRDDDLLVGTKFLENAISEIEKDYKIIVSASGSIIPHPISQESVQNRIEILGYRIHNKDNIQVDIINSGCFVCHRKMLEKIFCLSTPVLFNCVDIVLSVAHSMLNMGTLIVPKHNSPDDGILEYLETHNSGVNSKPVFAQERSEMILNLIRQGWKPDSWLNYRGTK